MSKGKIGVLVLVLVLAVVLIDLGPDKYLSLEFIKSKLHRLIAYKEAHPVGSIAIFSAIYIAVTAASIPGALVLTLTAGAIFGFLGGVMVAVTSATIGATIAFLIARYLFDDLVRKRMGGRLAKIRESFAKEGALYLFSMRLVPVVPFFVINLLMGLTPIKTLTYMIASLIGMLPGTMVFVNAGTQLAKLDSVKGLLSPTIIASFILLAIFPYLARFLLKLVKNKTA